MKKIKFLILCIGIVFLAGCGCSNKNQTTNPAVNQKNDITAKTSEEKFQKNAVEDIIAKINSINNGAIEVTTDKGEEITLKIPEKGASFMKQVVQPDKKILLQEIGLLDLPKNQNLDIKYNGQSNEVMLIIIK
jgi:hypothetical protein